MWADPWSPKLMNTIAQCTMHIRPDLTFDPVYADSALPRDKDGGGVRASGAGKAAGVRLPAAAPRLQQSRAVREGVHLLLVLYRRSCSQHDRLFSLYLHYSQACLLHQLTTIFVKVLPNDIRHCVCVCTLDVMGMGTLQSRRMEPVRPKLEG